MPGKTGTPSLLPLFRSELQPRLLERLLLHPQREMTVAELAEACGVTGQAIRNELRRFVNAGILEESHVGRVHTFRAATESPVYEPLSTLLERTVGVEPELRHALEALPGVEAAAVYGSWAAGDIRPDSDVDVLVIGDVDYPTLIDRVAEVQERSGREVNLVTVSSEDFRQKLAEGSGFIRSIVASDTLPLVGQLPIG